MPLAAVVRAAGAVYPAYSECGCPSEAGIQILIPYPRRHLPPALLALKSSCFPLNRSYFATLRPKNPPQVCITTLITLASCASSSARTLAISMPILASWVHPLRMDRPCHPGQALMHPDPLRACHQPGHLARRPTPLQPACAAPPRLPKLPLLFLPHGMQQVGAKCTDTLPNAKRAAPSLTYRPCLPHLPPSLCLMASRWSVAPSAASPWPAAVSKSSSTPRPMRSPRGHLPGP